MYRAGSVRSGPHPDQPPPGPRSPASAKESRADLARGDPGQHGLPGSFLSQGLRDYLSRLPDDRRPDLSMTWYAVMDAIDAEFRASRDSSAGPVSRRDPDRSSLFAGSPHQRTYATGADLNVDGGSVSLNHQTLQTYLPMAGCMKTARQTPTGPRRSGRSSSSRLRPRPRPNSDNCDRSRWHSLGIQFGGTAGRGAIHSALGRTVISGRWRPTLLRPRPVGPRGCRGHQCRDCCRRFGESGSRCLRTLSAARRTPHPEPVRGCDRLFRVYGARCFIAVGPPTAAADQGSGAAGNVDNMMTWAQRP